MLLLEIDYTIGDLLFMTDVTVLLADANLNDRWPTHRSRRQIHAILIRTVPCPFSNNRVCG